ncbi:hypothetical protein GCM10007938_15890 [Vibrio zhanjiangensis]|uniref:Uncharacterized protein n=1 Tax=Vibrio zhanjiangensis TaxID=1046128 RepID=A0ABQ6EXM4_9VIBR|nr:M91 family zinc metallopeptidase [Vibrio zhanjiangensis]GLT17811.1 hypothetical protein GCM10007938_15890 [Vibrio zhanjiangensis]
MVIETNKLNPTTVVNSGTTQLEFKKNPVARSLTRASNDRNATPKSTNAKAIATTPDGPAVGKTVAAVEKKVGFEQESQANTDVLETETQEHIESFLQNFESIHRDWEEFKLLGYNRKSPQVNQEAITELKKTATELRQHKDQQVIDKATEVLSLLKNFPQKDINALVSRKLAHDNEKERGKAVVMVAHVNASIAMLQDGLETLAHSRQRNLSQKVKEKTRDAVIAQTLTHLSQGKEDQEALTVSLQTILDEDKGPLAKKLTKAQSSEFEATCITEAEKLREKAHSLQETATRVSRPMIKVRGFLGNVHKSPISIENRVKAEKFLANSSNLLKELSNDISDSAQALSPQKSTISKVGASVGNSLIKALVAFDNPDYALESAANMVEKGGKSIAMGANALRSTAIYGTHKTTQAANTKKINHLETAEQIVDSTARAFLNQMLGAQEHITRSVDPLLSTLTTLIKEDEKLKEKLGWNYAEDFALSGDISTKNMQKALQSKEGESRERAVLNAVLDESLRISQTQKSKESRSWFQSHENLKQSVVTVNQSINRALTMISDSNLQAVQERILDRVPVELKPEVTKSLADLTCQMADYRTQLEKSVKALKTAVNLSGHGDFEDARKNALAAKEEAGKVKQKIKTKSTELTGESLHTYSRHGRLAKSIGEWINNTKLEFSDEPKEVGEIIDRVLQGLEHDGLGKLLSKQGDPLAILGSERVKTAESEAAEKMLLWGKSAAEIMKERGDLKDYFFRWGEKNVSYAAAVSLIGGAVGEGVAALEYLADFDPSLKPKMGLLKVALAPLTMEIGIRKLKNSVKPGQDLPFEEINQYVREESLKAAFRLATGLMPRGAKSALGAAITVGGLATGNSNLGKTVKSHFILDTAYVTGFMGARAVADEVIGEVLKGKTLSEDIQPTEELSNAFEQSSATSNTYPAIARGKGEYKEAVVDAQMENHTEEVAGNDSVGGHDNTDLNIQSLVDKVKVNGSSDVQAKTREALNTLCQTEDGRAMLNILINSGMEFEIRYAGETGDELRQEGGRTFFASSTDVDNGIIYFDPFNTLSATSGEDIEDDEWRERDPSIALFHELKHIYDRLASQNANLDADVFTENGYRQQFYALRGEEAVLRDDDSHGTYADGRVGFWDNGPRAGEFDEIELDMYGHHHGDEGFPSLRERFRNGIFSEERAGRYSGSPHTPEEIAEKANIVNELLQNSGQPPLSFEERLLIRNYPGLEPYQITDTVKYCREENDNWYFNSGALDSAREDLHHSVLANRGIFIDEFLEREISQDMGYNLRQKYSGDSPNSILDQKVTVVYDKRVTTREKSTNGKSGDYKITDTTPSKTFTIRQIANDEHLKYARENDPAGLGNYMNVSRYQAEDSDLADLARKVTDRDFQTAYDTHIQALKNDSEFMSSLDYFYQQAFEAKLEQLGISERDVFQVDVKMQVNGGWSWNSEDVEDHSLFAFYDKDNKLKLFSPHDNREPFTFDDVSAANNAMLDNDSEFATWVRQSSDPKWQSYLDKPREGSFWSFTDNDHAELELVKCDGGTARRNTNAMLDMLNNYMDIAAESDLEQVGHKVLSIYKDTIGVVALAATEGFPPGLKFLARAANAAIQGGLETGLAETVADKQEAGAKLGVSVLGTAAFPAGGGAAKKAGGSLGQLMGQGKDAAQNTGASMGGATRYGPYAANKGGLAGTIAGAMVGEKGEEPTQPPSLGSFLQVSPAPRDLSPDDKLRMLNDKFDEQMYQALSEDRFSNQNDPNHERLRRFLTNVLSRPSSQFGELNTREFLEGAIDVASDSVVNHILPKLQQAMEVLSSGGTVENVRALFA